MADFKQDAADRAKELRAKNKKMNDTNPIGGKSAKMDEAYPLGPEGISGRNGQWNTKAADAAYDHTMNLRESEAEDQEKRAGRNAGEIGKKWNEQFK
jgi:hypothetical protein